MLASWRPDPEATHIDAFSIDLSKFFFYAFPPFSLVAQCLQKVEWDQAEGIIVVSNWPTQPWFSKLMQLLTETPWIIPKSKTTLQLPWDVHRVHPPLHSDLTLLAAATSIIVSSWRPSSGNLYQSYINRWKTYCAAASDTSISQYVGCPRCATSFKDIGPRNRYHLERFNAEVDYAIIALVSAQRHQSIQLLNIDYMVKDDTSYVFTIKDHIKQSRPGYTPPRIELKAFPHNPNICVGFNIKQIHEQNCCISR
ncbi:Hypothetical predicted protein [Paramuricea clavata]|uniref:Uncharacterized protein n=1 Tax=Paramuricea clavata TaxID=317549 RepID=A0A6S7HZC6_PARCT|nr:Hypothetical predicted protein [Paramuricea clavata]